jgi:hypothetical protein
MSEDEIVKHTKKFYKIWFSKEHSLWHKLSEFLVEIIIIVFAVSVSIWFHSRSEYAHQQEEVKQFLLGLKADLTNDIREMQNDEASYEMQKKIFSYITSIRLEQRPSKDTVRKYQNWLFNTTRLNPNNGRYEGFKSSGKIGSIEDPELQNDIMDLYQENIPALLASSDAYIENKKKLFDFVIKNEKRLTDSTSNLTEILKTDEGFLICSFLRNPEQVFQRYDGCISLMQKIIGEIKRKYEN